MLPQKQELVDPSPNVPPPPVINVHSIKQSLESDFFFLIGVIIYPVDIQSLERFVGYSLLFLLLYILSHTYFLWRENKIVCSKIMFCFIMTTFFQTCFR